LVLTGARERLTTPLEEGFKTGGPMDYYTWLKALHVMAIIAWMAGLLYLPRLFVYHSGVPAGSDQARTLETMERRLLRAIMNPAMIVVWITGLSLAIWGGWFKAGWLHGKLLLVIGLTVAHMYFAKRRRLLAEGRDDKSSGFYRALNEVPTVLMIGIVILVIVKPF
jgi:putative membrane protein